MINFKYLLIFIFKKFLKIIQMNYRHLYNPESKEIHQLYINRPGLLVVFRIRKGQSSPPKRNAQANLKRKSKSYYRESRQILEGIQFVVSDEKKLSWQNCLWFFLYTSFICAMLYLIYDSFKENTLDKKPK